MLKVDMKIRDLVCRSVRLCESEVDIDALNSILYVHYHQAGCLSVSDDQKLSLVSSSGSLSRGSRDECVFLAALMDPICRQLSNWNCNKKQNTLIR